MEHKIYELSSQYMKDLKTLLKAKKIKPYDMAHASFRKNNSHWIIKKVDKYEKIIEYLNGDRRKFEDEKTFKERIIISNEDYPKSKKKYIKRYFRIIKEWYNRKKAKKYKKNSIISRINPNQIKQLLKTLK
jgi:hypothetical protein